MNSIDNITLRDFVKIVEKEAEEAGKKITWVLKFCDDDEDRDEVFQSFDSFGKCVDYLSNAERGTMTTDWISKKVVSPKWKSYYMWDPYFTFKIDDTYKTVKIDYVCSSITNDLKDSIVAFLSECEKASAERSVSWEGAADRDLSWARGYQYGRTEELEVIIRELKRLIE